MKILVKNKWRNADLLETRPDVFLNSRTQLSLIPDNYNQMTDQELIKYYCQFWE